MKSILQHLLRNRVSILVLFVAAALVFAASSLFTTSRSTAVSAAVGVPTILGEIVVEADSVIAVDSTEVLWLARAIYSETKVPREQEMVAWVIRNRVETGYRGQDSYKGVVLDPWQFSAFNMNSPKRKHYSSLTHASRAPGFKRALSIADRVANAGPDVRPFSVNTRHFYSEQSMVGRKHPVWAKNQQPIALDRRIDPRRFRFFADIS